MLGVTSRGQILSLLTLMACGSMASAAIIDRLERRQVRLQKAENYILRGGYIAPAFFVVSAEARKNFVDYQRQERQSCEPETLDRFSRCSFSFLSPKHIATAAHCVARRTGGRPSSADLQAWQENVWVVDLPTESERELTLFGEIGDLLFYQYEPGVIDLAVFAIEMSSEFPVPVVQIRWTAVEANEAIEMLSYPLHQPLHYSGPARVVAVRDSRYYTDLDAQHGDSGAPVVSLREGTLLGILVGGPRDRMWQEERQCFAEQSYQTANAYYSVVQALDVLPLDLQQKIKLAQEAKE